MSGLYALNSSSNKLESINSTNKKLLVSDSNVTKGNSATAAGAEMQQVLLYGKKPDNTLQPLETLGDRLLVDVLELAASGRITTSTALSSVQVCGYDSETTNKFKTLNVDDAGKLKTIVNKTNRGSQGNLSNNVSLTFGSTTTSVDVSKMNKAYVLYEDTLVMSFDHLDIEISGDGVSYYKLQELYPSPPAMGGATRSVVVLLDLHGISNLRLKNVSMADTYTNVIASIFGTI